MQTLNLPKYEFRLKKRDTNICIFDEIRKKYLVCTPEEWVRQNLIKYFINEKSVPVGLISLEKEIVILGFQRRYDALVSDRSGNALMLVECKAPEVKITQKVFQQIAEYNIYFKVPYLFVSNGLSHYICKVKDDGKIEFLTEMPDYSVLQAR